MPNYGSGQGRRFAAPVPPRQGQQNAAGSPVESREPEVRRWPHPVNEGIAVSRDVDPTLHYIYCALAYQNQLLADIKTLLEKLSEDCASGRT